MKIAPIKIFKLLLIVSAIIIFQTFLNSCQLKDSIINPMRSRTESSTGSSMASSAASNLSQNENIEVSKEEIENKLVFFDYGKIKLDITSSIGIKIKNCNLILDYFGNLNVLGEIENLSSSNKTGIIITFEFYNKKDEIIFTDTMPAGINYLRISSRLPFGYTVKEAEKYIDISRIKIGVNYKDYYQLLEGNAIVRKEAFYYTDNILHIDGNIINIGENKIVNLILLASFYNDRDGVVFIRQGYLPKQELLPQEQQNFSLEVLLSKYTPYFTHYDFEVFFEDSVKMP